MMRFLKTREKKKICKNSIHLSELPVVGVTLVNNYVISLSLSCDFRIFLEKKI